MTVLLWGAGGAGGAVVYAFVSFYLLTPLLRDDPISLIHYAIQGFIFGVTYVGLRQVTLRILRIGRPIILANVICGSVSGLLSSSYASLITYYTAIWSVYRGGAEVLPEVRTGVLLTLITFSAGNMLIGLIVGILVGCWQRNSHE